MKTKKSKKKKFKISPKIMIVIIGSMITFGGILLNEKIYLFLGGFFIGGGVLP